MAGSSRLDEDAARVYLDLFGVRYSRVQWQPHVPPRRLRRKQRRSRQDLELAEVFAARDKRRQVNE